MKSKYKILLIHNTYQQKGGEDSVFENEYNLLRDYGIIVDKLVFSNTKIQSFKDKLKFGIYSIYNPDSAKILERKIKKFKPNVIHIHNFIWIASPSVFFTARKYNIPVVMTLHNYRLICPNALLFREGRTCEKCIDKTFPLYGIKYRCYRDSLLQTLNLSFITTIHRLIGTWQNKIDKFITLTNFQKRKFLSSSLNISENKYVVKPNFTEDFGEGSKKRKDYFLYVGRLSKEKGILTMLKAFSNTNLKLIIIGEGELRNKVLEFTNKNKNIKYLGFKKKKEIIEFLKNAKALIFPSEWYEGFPMTIVEAFSTGTPVISSNIGSQAEIIKDGYTGLHFEVGNYVDLRNKIKKFLNMTNENFYTNARKEYVNKYTPQKNFEMLNKIYEEVINASQKKSN